MKRFGFRAIGAATFSVAFVAASPASAQSGPENNLAAIFYTGANFCPRGSLAANGAVLSIAQNTALFSLLGTTYGGNGQTTFQLPDLNSRRAVGGGQGAGPGLSSYTLGEASGSESAVMTQSTMPMHVHTANLRAIDVNADVNNAVRAGLGKSNSVLQSAFTTGQISVNMRAGDVQMDSAGGGQPFAIRNPDLALTACVVTEGIFPSRN